MLPWVHILETHMWGKKKRLMEKVIQKRCSLFLLYTAHEEYIQRVRKRQQSSLAPAMIDILGRDMTGLTIQSPTH